MTTIVIGLGGTGREIIKYLKKESKKSFDKNRMDVQALIDKQKYLYIDLEPRTVDKEAKSLIEEQEFIHLTKNTQNSKIFLQEQLQKEAFKEIWPEDIYMPDTPIPPFSSNGAGQIRLMGRLALYHDFYQQGQIKNRINSYMNKRDPNEDFNVILCGSIAGGTCSGLWLDLAYYIHHVLKQTTIGADNYNLNGYFILKDAALMSRIADSIDQKIASAMTYSCIWEMNTVMSQKFNKKKIGFPLENPGEMIVLDNIRTPFNTIGLIDSENDNNATLTPPNWKSYTKMTAQFIFDNYLREGSAIRSAQVANSQLTTTSEDIPRAFERISRVILRYPKDDWIEYIMSELLDDPIQDYSIKEGDKQNFKEPIKFLMEELLELEVKLNFNKAIFDYKSFKEKYLDNPVLNDNLNDVFNMGDLYYRDASNMLSSKIQSKETDFNHFNVIYKKHLNEVKNSIESHLTNGKQIIEDYIVRKFTENLIDSLNDKKLSEIHQYLHWLGQQGSIFRTMKEGLIDDKKKIKTEIDNRIRNVSSNILNNKKQIKKNLLNEDSKIRELYLYLFTVEFLIDAGIPLLENKTNDMLEAINYSVGLYTKVLGKCRNTKTAVETGRFISDNYDSEGMIVEIFGLKSDSESGSIDVMNKNWIENNIIKNMKSKSNEVWSEINRENISLIQKIMKDIVIDKIKPDKEIFIEELYSNIKEQMRTIIDGEKSIQGLTLINLPDNILESIIMQVAVENNVTGKRKSDICETVVKKHSSKIEAYMQRLKTKMEGVSSPFLKMSDHWKSREEYKVKHLADILFISEKLSGLSQFGYSMKDALSSFGDFNITQNMANPMFEIYYSVSEWGQIITMEKINQNIKDSVLNKAKYFDAFQKAENNPKGDIYRRIHLDKRLMPHSGLYTMMPSGEDTKWIFYLGQAFGIIEPQLDKNNNESGYYLIDGRRIKSGKNPIKGREKIIEHFTENQPLQEKVRKEINKQWQAVPATGRKGKIESVIRFYKDMTADNSSNKMSASLKESYREAYQLLQRMFENDDFNKAQL